MRRVTQVVVVVKISVLCLLVMAMPTLVRADMFTGTVNFGTPVPYIFSQNAGDFAHAILHSIPDTSETELRISLGYHDFAAPDFSAPAGGGVQSTFAAGDSGDWLVEVVDPNPGSYNYNLSITGNDGPILRGSAFTGTAGHASPAEYIVPAHAGDTLYVNAWDNLYNDQAEIKVWDPIGNLIGQAVAGDGASGAMFPDLATTSTGNYKIDVSDFNNGPFNFNLVIAGNTGGDPHAAAAAVPEPGSFLFLGTGLATLAGAIRRRLRR